MNKRERELTRRFDGPAGSRDGTADAGGLSPAERAEQERVVRIGNWLRQFGRAPEMPHGEYFTGRVLAEIRSRPAPAPALWRWATGGFGAVAVAAALYLAVVQPNLVPAPKVTATEVLSARVGDRSISAVAFRGPERKSAVLWLEGLDYLPSEYPVQ